MKFFSMHFSFGYFGAEPGDGIILQYHYLILAPTGNTVTELVVTTGERTTALAWIIIYVT